MSLTTQVPAPDLPSLHTPPSKDTTKAEDQRVVKVLSTSYVTPAEETPKQSVWMSNLDLLGNRRCYTPTVYLYKPPVEVNGEKDFFSAHVLKEALSKSLVPLYPFAGELVESKETGRIELVCSGRGVLFLEASCEWTMDEFDFTPSPSVAKLFLSGMPSADPPCPVMVIQLTRFKCGGVCLGTAVHHMMGDGTSSLRLINAWADVARGGDPSAIAPPVLDRSLLKARSPPSVQFEHKEYEWCLAGADPNVPAPPPPAPAAVETLKISKLQVAKLKSMASPTPSPQADGSTSRPMSTFSAVIGHAWKCACKARNLGHDQPSRVFMSGDVRSRLRPPVPAEFIGNATLLMRTEATVAEVLDGGGAAKIEDSKSRLYDGYLRSLIDYLETEEGLRRGRAFLPPTDHMAVNWLNLPIYLADFGWGRPVYMHRAVLPVRGGLYALRNPLVDGEVLLTVALEKEFIDEFKNLFYQELEDMD